MGGSSAAKVGHSLFRFRVSGKTDARLRVQTFWLGVWGVTRRRMSSATALSRDVQPRSLVQRSHLSLDQRDRLRLSAGERRAHPARLPGAVLGAHRLSRLPGDLQAVGLGPLLGGGGQARRPPVGTQLSRHLRLGLSDQRPRLRRVEPLHGAFSQADAAGPCGAHDGARAGGPARPLAPAIAPACVRQRAMARCRRRRICS